MGQPSKPFMLASGVLGLFKQPMNTHDFPCPLTGNAGHVLTCYTVRKGEGGEEVGEEVRRRDNEGEKTGK